jgi:hypothetical protein
LYKGRVLVIKMIPDGHISLSLPDEQVVLVCGLEVKFLVGFNPLEIGGMNV